MSAGALNLFPSRVAIGTVRGADVYMSREFERALADLLTRVGGAYGASNEDLGIELAGAGPAALALGLLQTVADLQLQVEGLTAQLAQAAQLAARLAHLEGDVVIVAPPADWEHPGKVGAAAPNSGKFTTLEATDKVKLNPLDKDVEIKPTGASLVTIKPAAAGQLDNLELGKTAPAPARVVTLNKITFTQPANGATLTLADGATLSVPGVGGTLGSAAYANAGAFAARSGAALAGVATDPATTQALANSLRAVLLSVGIGS